MSQRRLAISHDSLQVLRDLAYTGSHQYPASERERFMSALSESKDVLDAANASMLSDPQRGAAQELDRRPDGSAPAPMTPLDVERLIRFRMTLFELGESLVALREITEQCEWSELTGELLRNPTELDDSLMEYLRELLNKLEREHSRLTRLFCPEVPQ